MAPLPILRHTYSVVSWLSNRPDLVVSHPRATTRINHGLLPSKGCQDRVHGDDEDIEKVDNLISRLWT